MYNPSSKCAIHQRGMIVRLRRLEAKPVQRTCAQCGSAFVTSNPRRKYCSARCRSHSFAEREKAMRQTIAAASDGGLAA